MIFWVIICHVILSVNSSPFFNWALSSTTKACDWGTEDGKSVTTSRKRHTPDQLASPADGAIEATTQATSSDCGDDSKEIIEVIKQLVDQTEDDTFDPSNFPDTDDTTCKQSTQTTEFTYFKRWFPEPATKPIKPSTEKSSIPCSTINSTTETCTHFDICDAEDQSQKIFRIDSMDNRVEDKTPKMKVFNSSKSCDSISKIINPEIMNLAVDEKFPVTTPDNNSIFIQEVISSPAPAEISANKSNENYVSDIPFVIYSPFNRNSSVDTTKEYENIVTSPNPDFTLVSSPRSHMLFNFAFTKMLDYSTLIRDTTRDLRTVKIIPIVGAIPSSYTNSISSTEPITPALPMVNTERYLKSLVAKHKNTNCMPHHKPTTETSHTSEVTCKTTKEVCETTTEVTTAKTTCDFTSETTCATTEETTCKTTQETTCKPTEEPTCKTTTEAITETTCPTTQETTTCETTTSTTTCPTTSKCTTTCKPSLPEVKKTTHAETTTTCLDAYKLATDADKSTIPTTKRVYGGELNVKFKYP